MGSRIYLKTHAGRSRVLACYGRDRGREKFYVPSHSLSTCFPLPRHDFGLGRQYFQLPSGIRSHAGPGPRRAFSLLQFVLPDGRFFASTATPQEIHVWKEVTTGYALHQKFSFAATFIREGLLFSPNGESILLFTHQAIHTWPTRYQSLFLPSIPVRDIDRYNFVLEFSPCRALAAFVPAMENMVTVLDLASGHPRLVIDAGMRVVGLGITGSTILVVGERKIVTWNVPAETAPLAPR